MNTITINDGYNQPNRSLSVGLPTQGQYCNEPLLNYQNINVVKQFKASAWETLRNPRNSYIYRYKTNIVGYQQNGRKG